MPDPEEDEDESKGSAQQSANQSLVDELGVVDLADPIFGGRGRLFSAAGRNSPVAEFTRDFLVLHPPQKPFEDEYGPAEDITLRSTESGILLNEINQEKTIAGARFNGHQLYYLRQIAPGTLKHYAGWRDEEGKVHPVMAYGHPITTDDIFRLRNTTLDGEISVLLSPEDDDPFEEGDEATEEESDQQKDE